MDGWSLTPVLGFLESECQLTSTYGFHRLPETLQRRQSGEKVSDPVAPAITLCQIWNHVEPSE
ncbi:myosin heavy chain 1/2/3/4/8/13/7B/15 [Sarotherodon galilaeus]